MELDPMVIAAVAQEAQAVLRGGRILRVWQPDAWEVALEIRLPRDTRFWVVSTHPVLGRVAVAAHWDRENPRVPALFCQTLRKHLEGGRVLGCRAVAWQRVVELEVEALDPEGRRVVRRLVAELFGRRGNLALLDAEAGTIIDALHRVEAETRSLLPGEPYRLPATAGFLASGEPTREQLAAFLIASPPQPSDSRAPEQWLRRLFPTFLSPALACELAFRAGLDRSAQEAVRGEGAQPEGGPGDADLLDRLLAAWRDLTAPLRGERPFAPRLLLALPQGSLPQGSRPAAEAPPAPGTAPGAPTVPATPAASGRPATSPPRDASPAAAAVGLAAVEMQSLPAECQLPFPTMSQAVLAYFAPRQEAQEREDLRRRLQQIVRAALSRVRRRLEAQTAELSRAQQADRWRLAGETLTANLWRLGNGEAARHRTEITLPAPDGSGTPVTIQLDPSLSLADNARHFFNRYRKEQRALQVKAAQVEKTREELAYLEQLEESIEEAETCQDLKAIEVELEREGVAGYRGTGAAPHAGQADRDKGAGRGGGGTKGVSPAARRNAWRQEGPLPPLRYVTRDGLEVLVGRNNHQNDWLTLRHARPEDLWLHTQKIPGAHVILHCPPGGLEAVPETSLYQAAMVAAYHSRARFSSHVPVDMTARKHVRKPPGARPGMVIYDSQRTLYVTPDESLVLSLRQAADRPEPPAAP